MSGRRRTIGRLLPVEVPGFHGRVHVREDGPADAPVLLLLHGFCGSLHWYDLVVPFLADRFRLVRVDLLGHGSTGGPAADAPLQARVVDALLDQLDVPAATVVGHSFGADVAVELAERSARVNRLVIVTQAPDYSEATLPRGRWLMTVPGVGAALGRFFQVAAGLVSASFALRRRHRAVDDLILQGLHDFRALSVGMFPIVIVERRDRMARRPLDDQVRDAGKPTLVILGEKDHFYGAGSADRYGRAGARVEVLAESGHSPLVELPGRTAALIGAFAEPALTDD